MKIPHRRPQGFTPWATSLPALRAQERNLPRGNCPRCGSPALKGRNLNSPALQRRESEPTFPKPAPRGRCFSRSTLTGAIKFSLMSDTVIFISHASADDAFVAELRQALEALQPPGLGGLPQPARRQQARAGDRDGDRAGVARPRRAQPEHGQLAVGAPRDQEGS